MTNAIVDRLKSALDEDGRSHREVARLASVDPAIVCRLNRGYGGLSLDSLARLCDVLGLELRKRED